MKNAINRQKLTFFSELIGIDCRVAEEEVKKIFQTVHHQNIIIVIKLKTMTIQARQLVGISKMTIKLK